MAQLHQIVGAILRDIAQARVTSDIYSREVSRYYEQDSLLRLFPIPRSEIQDANIELRFAISEICVDPERREEREAKIARIIEVRSERITHEIFEQPGPESFEVIEEWQTYVERLKTPDFRSTLRHRILDYLETNWKALITITAIEDGVEISLEIESARDGVRDLLETLICTQEDFLALDKQFDLLTRLKQSWSGRIRTQFEEMQGDLEIVELAEEFKVDVDVTADKLQGIPEAAISSIKITATMRNYVWSQVEDSEGVVIRRLIPE